MVISKIVAFTMLAAVSTGLKDCEHKKNEPKAALTYVCAKIKQYSCEEQKRAAEEMDDYKDKIPVLRQWIADYGSVRNALATCPANAGKKSGGCR